MLIYRGAVSVAYRCAKGFPRDDAIFYQLVCKGFPMIVVQFFTYWCAKEYLYDAW